jgi:hypothetical protein
MMKKYFGILASLLLLTGCDDGEIKVDNLDFESATVKRCSGGNILYKLNDTEALFFESDYEAAFINDPTLEGSPRIFPISSTNQVYYRDYNGNVSLNNICDLIQPATPTVREQWTASDGSIEVTTAAVTIANTALAGGEKISAYRHTVTFRNIIFQKPSGNQLYETFSFGTYETPATTLPFNFDDEIDRCGYRVYNYNGSEAILIDLDPTLIQSSVTQPGVPRTGLLGPASQLYYILFNGLVDSDYLCASTIPATPVPVEFWSGAAGVENVSGIIEVTTTTNGTGFQHEIHLKKVTLTKGNSAFLLADDYLLGNLITN